MFVPWAGEKEEGQLGGQPRARQVNEVASLNLSLSRYFSTVHAKFLGIYCFDQDPLSSLCALQAPLGKYCRVSWWYRNLQVCFPSPAAFVRRACCLERPDGSSPWSSACVRTAQPSDGGALSEQCVCALPTPVQAVQAVPCPHGACSPSSAVPVRATGGHLSPLTPTQEGVQPNSWNRDLLVPFSPGLAPGSLGCHRREGSWLEENLVLV